MRAQEFLRQHRKFDTLIKNKLLELERLRDLVMNMSTNYGTERVQSSGSQQRMADAVVKIIDTEREINEYIVGLIEQEKEITSVIEQLPPLQYELLHKIYIQYKGVAESAYELDKSESWGATIHGRALAKVQRILDEKEQNA